MWSRRHCSVPRVRERAGVKGVTASATTLTPTDPNPNRVATGSGPTHGPVLQAPRSRLRPALLLGLWFAAVAAYSCYPVLRPRTKVLATLANDLANHVRHVYEYGLALKERQLPPVVLLPPPAAVEPPAPSSRSRSPQRVQGSSSR